MSHENEEKTEPNDKLGISWQVMAVEEEHEYIEDP
jgi:hypothetical protein